MERLNSLDRSFFLFLNSIHHPSLNSVMTLLSGEAIWAPFIAFFLFYSFHSKKSKNAFYFLFYLSLTLIASDITSSYVIKNIFNRLRPCRETELIPYIYFFGQKCGGKFGFVSSHAANAFALIFFSKSCLDFKNKWIHLIWIMPFVVSYSRIYLGVHYPGDILGGAVVGIFWGIFFSKLFNLSQGASR